MSWAIPPINIILADDHKLFCDGFSFMINRYPDICLKSIACNGIELIRKARIFNPDVIITDIRMPEMNGVSATSHLSKELPHIGIVALTMCEDDNMITDFLDAGGIGYLLKSADHGEIIEAIKKANRGESFFCRHAFRRIQEIKMKKATSPEFSAREMTIIKMICDSCCSQQIGDHLKLSRRTVENYRERIMQKMDVNKTIDLVKFALQHHIYEIELKS